MPLDETNPGSPEERQRYTRRSVLVAAKLAIGERLLDIDILDLSEGGAKITATEQIEVGTACELWVEAIGLIAAQVVWQSGLSHGLEFLVSPETVAVELPQIIETSTDARERRRHVRSTVLWRAEIFSGIRRAECEILNISESGARIRFDGGFKPSPEVTIRSLRFGERKGKLIWQDQDRLGIEFDDY